MKIIKGIENIVVKIDDFREEKPEDFIADSILAKLDGNTKVDELEKKSIIAGITAASAYASTYGLPTVRKISKKKLQMNASNA
jgi:hypothetical protein